MSEQTLKIIRIVEAVRAVEAKKRKAKTEKPNVIYFSKHVTWIYNAVLDNKLCDACLKHEAQPYFLGSEIKKTFPHLEIVDENTIKANTHPNCRCILKREVTKP